MGIVKRLFISRCFSVVGHNINSWYNNGCYLAQNVIRIVHYTNVITYGNLQNKRAVRAWQEI
jgi:hypothetical protein